MFFIFNKKAFKFIIIFENRLEDNILISFVHLWLYFSGFEIVCSFLKLRFYNLHMLHASHKGRDCHSNLIFLNLYITVLLYRRKYCAGHIIVACSGTINVKNMAIILVLMLLHSLELYIATYLSCFESQR